MGGFDIQRLMSQAKEQYEALQKKLQATVIDATAGGGSIKVRMNGQKQLLAITIDPEVVKSGDVEMLQDLVLAACNEAVRRIDDEMKSTVGGMMGGLGL